MIDEHTDLLVTWLGPQCLGRLTIRSRITAMPSVLHPINLRRPHCVTRALWPTWHPLDSCVGMEWMGTVAYAQYRLWMGLATK